MAGGYPDALEVIINTRTVTISVDYVEFDTSTDPTDVVNDAYVDIELMASAYDANRGATGLTLTDCKIVSYEMNTSQDGYVSYRMELRWAGAHRV